MRVPVERKSTMNALAEMVGVSEVVIRSTAKLFADRGLHEHLRMAEIYAFTMAEVLPVVKPNS